MKQKLQHKIEIGGWYGGCVVAIFVALMSVGVFIFIITLAATKINFQGS